MLEVPQTSQLTSGSGLPVHVSVPEPPSRESLFAMPSIPLCVSFPELPISLSLTAISRDRIIACAAFSAVWPIAIQGHAGSHAAVKYWDLCSGKKPIVMRDVLFQLADFVLFYQ